MSGKTTRGPVDSHDEGPQSTGKKLESGVKDQETLDKAPVLEQRETIVDGNVEVPTHETHEGEPFDQEQYDKDRAAGIGASGNTGPLDDVAIGLQPGGAGNPAAASHQSGAMDVPDAEGDPDSIAAWNARHAAQDAYSGSEAQEKRADAQEAVKEERARADARAREGQRDTDDAKKNR